MSLQSCIAVSVVILLFLGGCSGMDKRAEPLSGASSFDISADERTELKAAASKGDADAAFRLYEYYDFVALDPDEAKAWLRRSAELGNRTAQYNLGVLLLESAEPGSGEQAEAIEWLERARSSGSEKAQKKLDSLNLGK